MRIWLFILFFFSLSTLLAQKIFVSEKMPMRTDGYLDIVGKIDEKLIVLLENNNDYELSAFNDKMFKIWNKTLELEGRNREILEAIAPVEAPYLFYVFFTHREKSGYALKAYKIDGMGMVQDTMLIKTIDNAFAAPDFQAHPSEDKSKVLFYDLDYGKVKQMFVFDTQTDSLLWEDDFSDVRLGGNQDLHQLVIDNTGNAYLLLSRDNYHSKSKTHHFEIVAYDVGSQSRTNYTVELEGLLTYDNLFEFDNLNQNLVAAGLYSEKNRGRADGFYYLKIPKDRPEDYRFAAHPFEETFVHEYMDKPKAKQMNIDNTKVNQVLFRRDGGVLLVGERSRISSGANAVRANPYAPPYQRSGQDYFFTNMLICSIHPDGTPHWQNVLHKRQYSFDDQGIYSSYFLLKTSDSIHVLFNDDIKSENTVSEYTIFGNGTYQRNSILNTEDQDIRLQFREGEQVDASELIVPSQYRNRLQLVKIQF